MEERKKKFLPTEEDLHPNTRFIDNKFYHQLAENQDLLKYIDKYKINWVDQEEMVRKLLIQIRESKDFTDYLNKSQNSYNDDKDIFIKIIKKFLARSEILQFYYEEKSIYWHDDFHTANFLVIKTIKGYEAAWDQSHKLSVFFKNEGDGHQNEDKLFIINLFRKTILKGTEYEKLIHDKVKNWEMDRIAIMDILIIKMALVELLEFPSIPIKVTLNEYIELAKLYSTPKSKIFVNGILDKLIGDLKAQKKIRKTGRGLLEN
jgi:N utilization substance protein B